MGSGYEGVVYPVNPNKVSILGVQTYSSFRDLSKVVDFALIATLSIKVTDFLGNYEKKGI